MMLYVHLASCAVVSSPVGQFCRCGNGQKEVAVQTTDTYVSCMLSTTTLYLPLSVDASNVRWPVMLPMQARKRDIQSVIVPLICTKQTTMVSYSTSQP